MSVFLRSLGMLQGRGRGAWQKLLQTHSLGPHFPREAATNVPAECGVMRNHSCDITKTTMLFLLKPDSSHSACVCNPNSASSFAFTEEYGAMDKISQVLEVSSSC